MQTPWLENSKNSKWKGTEINELLGHMIQDQCTKSQQYFYLIIMNNWNLKIAQSIKPNRLCPQPEY